MGWLILAPTQNDLVPEGVAPRTVASKEAACFLQLKLQLKCLRYRAGVRLGLLPRLTHQGQAYSYQHVERQYFFLLRSWEAPSTPPRVTC